MRIILLGPQGSGKGTQADRLASSSGARHLATGDLVRAAIATGSPLGTVLRSYNDRGELVPDQIMVRMIQPALSAPEGWILDGFPRTETQARALNSALGSLRVALERVVALEVPTSILLTRLLARRQSSATGKTYNLVTNPPPLSDPGPFVRRVDDTPDDIRRRLELYRTATEPLKAYYAAQHLLVEIDASGSIETVTQAIVEALKES